MVELMGIAPMSSHVFPKYSTSVVCFRFLPLYETDERERKTSLLQKAIGGERREENLRTFPKYDTGGSLSGVEEPMVRAN